MCASNHGAGLGIPPAADCTATTDSLITAASRYLARSLACHRIATYLIDRRRRRQLPFTEGLSEFQTETRSLRCYHAATTSKFRMKLIGIHGAGRRNTPCHRLPSLAIVGVHRRESWFTAPPCLPGRPGPRPSVAIVVLCPHPSKRHSSRSIFPTYSNAPSPPRSLLLSSGSPRRCRGSLPLQAAFRYFYHRLLLLLSQAKTISHLPRITRRFLRQN